LSGNFEVFLLPLRAVLRWDAMRAERRFVRSRSKLEDEGTGAAIGSELVFVFSDAEENPAAVFSLSRLFVLRSRKLE